MNDITTERDDSGLSQMRTAGAILPASVNAGAVSIEIERAIAEAQGQLVLAKKFPRNIQAARSEIVEACKSQAMASIAFYTLPQGGQKVTGPSIKLIEQVASSLGNIEWGHRELSRTEAGPGPKDFGRSEIEVYAWDKEKNTRSIRQITVLHVLDTKDGARKLRDQRDIDNKIANVASKQMRGRLAALLPKWLVEAAIQECRKTLAGENERPMAERVAGMVDKFKRFGVTPPVLEAYLGHSLEHVLVDELIDLHGVYTALNDGGKPSEYFDLPGGEPAADKPASTINTAISAAQQPQAQAQQPPARAPRPARTPAQARPVDKEPAGTPAEAPASAPKASNPPAQQGPAPGPDDLPPDEGPLF